MRKRACHYTKDQEMFKNDYKYPENTNKKQDL